MADTLLGFITICLLIEVTPGPNMGYLTLLSISDGRRAGLTTVAGIALGLLIVGVAAAIGITTIISASPIAYESLRWLGVAYLLWIAWSSWQEDAETPPARPDDSGHNALFFRRGLLVNILNPKAAFFYISILPQFIDQSADTVGHALLLTLIYVLIATLVHLVIVILASRVRTIFDTPRLRIALRRIFSILLGIIALWFGYTTGRSS